MAAPDSARGTNALAEKDSPSLVGATTVGGNRQMIRKHYANVMSTIGVFAAIAALTMGGAIAAGKIEVVTSKQIKNGTIKTQDIARNGVRASDIRNGSVHSADVANGAIGTEDIGAGEVTPQDVSMPEPVQIRVPVGEDTKVVAKVGEQYTRISTVGSYTKAASDSALEVTWTGTAAADYSACNFELRVDGQSSGGGEVFAGGNGASISTTALFKDLPAGQKAIEVWAKHVPGGGDAGDCTLGPVPPNIAQTYVISEKVL